MSDAGHPSRRTTSPRDFDAPSSPAALTTARRRGINRGTAGIGLYAAAFGATFGAVAAATGLTLAQTMLLSGVMFTGASQFAFVGIIGSGGSPLAAIPAALLLGVRNAFYGVPVSGIVRPRGLRRWGAAHFVIDETTAMAVAQRDPAARRYAFWATGLVLFVLWNSGTVAGALVGAAVDPAALGLDAAAPAVFLALLWPQLKTAGAPVLAVLGAVLALLLIPVAPPGVPVIAAASVAAVAGLVGRVPAPAPVEDSVRTGGGA